MGEVTDPNILAQLNGGVQVQPQRGGGIIVTDPTVASKEVRAQAGEQRATAQNTFRTMTSEEVAAQGLPVDGVYQINGLGEIKTIKPPKTTPTGMEAAKQGAQLLLQSAGVVGGRDPVADLIRGSTSGRLQAMGAEAMGAVVGESTSGMENIAKLKSLTSDMVLSLTGGSLGAGVSNADVAFLKERVGNLGDPNIPANERLAAWEEVKSRLQRFAGEQPTSAPSTGGMPATPVTEEQSAALFGQARFDANGNPVGADYQGETFFADGTPGPFMGRITGGVPDPRDNMGLIEGVVETFTGNERSTPEIEALPDWTEMPLPIGLMEQFQTGLATMMSSPDETARIMASMVPGLTVRQDAKGNYILRNPSDGKEYAIKPGFRVSDIPRAIGAVAAFTPAGRATTLPGAFTANAATQAALETTQAAAGGTFDTGEIAIAGAGGALGQQAARGLGALRGRLNPRVPPSPEPTPPPTGGIDEPPPSAAPVTPEAQAEIGTIARQAIGTGQQAKNAQARLAIMAQVDLEAKAAAERLGMELPFDVLSNDARLLTTTGLARSQIGSDAQAAWGRTVSEAIEASDNNLRALGATRDLSEVSETVRTRLLKDMADLEDQATALRSQVDEAIDVRARADTPSLQAALAERINNLGGIEEAKQAFSAEEKKLLAMLGEGEVAKRPTYARLNQIRDDIGRALFKNQGPWVDAPTAALKRYYGALADDQIGHIESVGGKELADKMRGSNDLYSQMFKSRESMKTIYGKSLEKDIGPLIKSAVSAGAKGNAEALRKLVKAIPEDMQPQALLSGIFSQVERSGANGGFSFTRYAELYRGLRQNNKVYAEIARSIGPDASRVLQDLYSISKRVAAAEGKIIRTGASNQPLLNALNAEGLVSRLAAGAVKRGAVTGGTALAGGVAGGPVGAVVGGGIADAFQQAATQGGKSNLDKLHGVLVSEPFKNLVDKVADGTIREADINRAANDTAFRKFARSVLGIGEAAARKSWLKAATTAGATTQARSDTPAPARIEVQ